MSFEFPSVTFKMLKITSGTGNRNYLQGSENGRVVMIAGTGIGTHKTILKDLLEIEISWINGIDNYSFVIFFCENELKFKWQLHDNKHLIIYLHGNSVQMFVCVYLSYNN